MAGDWLKIECNTPDKPEVIGIADILGIPPTQAFGGLFMIWRWFDQHTTEGNASFVTKVTVDRLSGVTGFADAMVRVGWLLVADNGSITLPHFDRHNGETAKQRALTAKRVAKTKAKSNATGNDSGNGVGNGAGNDPVTPKALPREDKNSKPPLPPKGRRSAIEFKTFLQNCKESGEKPISGYQPVFDYCRRVDLSEDLMMLCWNEFYRRHAPGGVSEDKRYKDWRKAFRNCLEGNWYKLWWLNQQTNQYELTTAGHTAQKAAA